MSLHTFLGVFSEESEVKVNDRFGLGSPIPMMVIISLYLLIVLKLGPSLMKSREPYRLKTFIVFYNMFQVCSCAYISYKCVTSSIPIMEFWRCAPVLPNTHWERLFNHLGIVTFWLKATELTETLVFVLRKKQRQVSFLHVFHHAIMLFLTYIVVKFYKANQAFFPLFLNCNVHIIMYLYYLLAAALPKKVAARLTPFKKFITTIQLIQFVFILIQILITYITGCSVPNQVLIMYMLIVSAFFYMFYDFYKKNYNAKRRRSSVAMQK
ncbi:elongation of very long chain fatty acids protein 1-like [Episyrphus balteatus]|uniref:elongation of very long chain fatty acids protein 1-like n=1 Tax=Episyrphus balteatus TaxID=286459 RepID=UPI0024861E53|nr:elongation of very long chain fatty acids protein 1-like [Episyrphus balteatus]